MSEPHTKAPAPFSLRLTAEERRELDERAGRQPLGAHIRERLFAAKHDGNSSDHRRARGQVSIKDHQMLAQVLALLGQSRLASNLNQLARAANAGALPVTPETEAALRSAAEDVGTIKSLLMRSLGIRER